MGASCSLEAGPRSMPALAGVTSAGTLLLFVRPGTLGVSSFFEVSFVNESTGDILFAFGARPRQVTGLGAAPGGTVVLNTFEKGSGAWGQEVQLPYDVVFGERSSRKSAASIRDAPPLIISADSCGVTVYKGGARPIEGSPGGPFTHVHFFRWRRQYDGNLVFDGSVNIVSNNCSVTAPSPHDASLCGWLPAPRDPRLPNFLSPGAVLNIALPLLNESPAVRWRVCSYNSIPHTAIVCGQDWSGEELYLARCCLPDGSILLGKAGRSTTFRAGAHVPYFATEASCTTYEVFVSGGTSSTVWTKLLPGSILPPGAVACGRTNDGQILVPAAVTHFLQGKNIVTVGFARIDWPTQSIIATVAYCNEVHHFTTSSASISILCGGAPKAVSTANYNNWTQETPTPRDVSVGTPLPRFVGYSLSQYGPYETYLYEDLAVQVHIRSPEEQTMDHRLAAHGQDHGAHDYADGQDHGAHDYADGQDHGADNHADGDDHGAHDYAAPQSDFAPDYSAPQSHFAPDYSAPQSHPQSYCAPEPTAPQSNDSAPQSNDSAPQSYYAPEQAAQE